MPPAQQTAERPTKTLAWINWLAIAYTCGGWVLGVWLLTQPQFISDVAGVLLTAHALVCSAYLLHDCVHQALFDRGSANEGLGMLLCWINGACVADYQGLKSKHLRHHADRLDVVTFDYRATLNGAPVWLRRCVLALEWAYVPAVELLMRGLVISSAFTAGSVRERVRVTVLLTVRVAAFTALALISFRALLLYALAYLLFVQVLRFMDAFQHTYETFVSPSRDPAPRDPRRSRRYEDENTYSNLISVRWPWLNALVLNFAYHNAHHAQMGVPWYRLPSLHQRLYGGRETQVLPARVLFANYHRHRLARVLADDYGAVESGAAGASGFIGAVGVSFLTAV